MRVGVHLEPFLARRRRFERFDIAAQMKSEAAPISGRKEWNLDAPRNGGAQLEIGIIEGVPQPDLVDVREIAGQKLRIERGPRRDFPGEAIAVGSAGVAILVGRDLGVPKQLEKKRRV